MAREYPLGRVVTVAANGDVVTQAGADVTVQLGGRGDGVRPGLTAVDARHNRVGRVKDVIGPTDAPLIVIQADRGAALHALTGKDLFGLRGERGAPRHQGGDRRYPRADSRGPPRARDAPSRPPRQAGAPPPARPQRPGSASSQSKTKTSSRPQFRPRRSERAGEDR